MAKKICAAAGVVAAIFFFATPLYADCPHFALGLIPNATFDVYENGVLRYDNLVTSNAGSLTFVASSSASISVRLDDGGSDTVPPARVLDLASVPLTSVTLEWTAVGDNGSTGQASHYDIRFSTVPLSDATWATAQQAEGEPSPGPSGQSESFSISGLESATTYHFGIKVADEVFNWSPLSNIATVTTASSGTNLLVNPSFEDAGFPQPWQFQNNSGTSTVTKVADPVQGSWAARVTVATPGQYYETQLYQIIDVVQGGWYHVSLSAKSSVNNRQIVVGVTDAATAEYRGLWYQPVLSTGWQQFSTDFQATASGQVRFSMYVGAASGQYSFDVLDCTRTDADGGCIPPSDELLQNGGFDCSVSPLYWTLEDHLGGSSFVTSSPPYSGTYAVTVDPGQAGLYYQTQVKQIVGPIIAGQEYTFHCTAKSSVSNRPIVIGLIDGVTGGSLGLWLEPMLGTSWQSIDHSFTATASADSARFSFYVGQRSSSCLFDEASLLRSTGIPASTDIASALREPTVLLMPNPASSSASFVWTTPSPMSVDVLDITGRRVWEQVFPSGMTGAQWNLTDHGGSPLASGVYIVQFRANGRRDLRRLTVLR